jgi:conjugal transfer ATP-binding protein TraC
MSKRTRHDAAEDLFQVMAYDKESKIFYCGDAEDHMLGFGFVCDPMPGADDRVADRISALLNNNWPENSILQFALWAGPDITDYLNAMNSLRAGQNNELCLETTRQRAAMLQDGTNIPIIKSKQIRVRNLQLIVTCKVPLANPMPTDDEERTIITLRANIEQGLKTIGLYPDDLTADRWVQIMSTILNHGENASWRNGRMAAELDKPLRNQVLDWDTTVTRDAKGLWLGSTRVKTLSVKRYPQHLDFGHAAQYLGEYMTGSRGLRDNALITTTIIFPEPQAMKAKLSAKRTFAINQAYGPMLKFEPMLGHKKAGFEALFSALDDGDRPLRMYFNLTLFSENENAAVAAASNAIGYWGELGMRMMEDNYFGLTLMANSLPLCADPKAVDELFRYKTMATRHAVPILPIFGDWTGTGTPVMQFVSRNGVPMSLSLFDSTNNYNCCIAASSGNGKSFLANEIISSYLSVGARIWVIDVGRSYENICSQYNGDFAHFGSESSICVNPFQLVVDYEEEADMLSSLVATMAAPTEALTDFQNSALKRVMHDLWREKAGEMTVDDIAERLKSSENDIRIRDVGEQLYQFTSGGEYGRFFVGKNNMQFQNRFSVLELEELKGRPHLQQVVLLQLIYQIQYDMFVRAIRENDNSEKIVLIDEAWDLLSNAGPAVAKFLETGWRRFRKYNGAGICITQSVSDLYKTDVGRAIAENSANMYLLSQKTDSINDMRKKEQLPLSEGAYEMMKTVNTMPGHYSEVFCITTRGMGIAVLVVEPFRRLLYSTAPADRHALRAKQQQGMDLKSAINAVLLERNHGRDNQNTRVA